jgi:PAS domain S-box-containing protein
MAIPLILVYFVRKRPDIPFSWMFWMFGAFIVGCGFTHFMEVVTFTWPAYRLSALVKIATAAVSWATVIGLMPLIPQALALRSPRELEREIAERKKAEEERLHFKSLFESAPGLFVVLTPDLKIVAASDAYLRATMTKREEILGKEIFEVFPENPEDPSVTGPRYLRESLERVRRNKTPEVMAVGRYDVRRPEAEGGGFEERYWSPVNAPVFGSSKELAYIIHRVEDVTDFVRLKRQGAEQNKQGTAIRLRAEQMEAEIYLRAQELQDVNQQLRQANDALQKEINERKQAEEARRESEARLHLLVEGVKDYAIFMLDPQGNVLSWNSGAEKIKGYRADEIIGRHFSCFYTKEEAERGWPGQLLAKATVEGKVADEGWRVRGGGSRFWANVAITALRDEKGQLKGFSNVTRDLTERKQAEDALHHAYRELEERVRERTADLTRTNEQLRHEVGERKKAEEALWESQARLGGIVASAMDAIITVDAEQRIVLFNAAARRMFRCDAAEAVGQPLERFIPERFRAAHRGHIDTFGRSGVTNRQMGAIGNVSGLRADGEEFPIEASISQVDVAGQRLFTVILRDVTERMQAEEALRESEELHRCVSELTSDFTCVCKIDPAGKVDLVSATEGITKITGYTLKELNANGGWSALLPPEDLPIAQRGIEELARGEIARNELRCVNRTGEVRWLHFFGRPVWDAAHQRVTRIYTAVQDITERKRNEQERERLLQSEHAARVKAEQAERAKAEALALIDALFQNAPVGMAFMDRDLRYVHINASLAAINGRPEAEHYGRTLQEMIPQVAPIVEPLHRHALESGEPIIDQEITGETAATRGQTHHWLASYFPVRIQGGQILGVGVVVLDITERKRAEVALRESEMRNRAILESASDSIITMDHQGNVLEFNLAAERMFGYVREDVLGKSMAEFVIPPSLREAHRRGLAHYLATGEGLVIGKRLEIAALRADGTEFPVELSIVRIPDSEPAAFTGFIRDITERKRSEEALAQHAEELARSNAELEQFAYVASHDLQEPLRMVSSYVELLARRYGSQLDEKADKFIGYAVDGAMRMQTLIEALLSYSRVDTKGTSFEPVDSAVAVGQAVANLQHAIQTKGTVVTHDLLPRVTADAVQLTQLFQNLIGNAIKFCEAEPSRVHLGAKRDGKEWIFSVRDNGIGIHPEHAQRIFLIFQRLHSRAKYPGTGIGLAICKKIVERHGGRIWVESQLGGGSVFYFSIPIKGENGHDQGNGQQAG